VKQTNLPARRQAGVSLIELVIVIVIFSATIVALLSGVSEAGRRSGDNSQSFFAQQWAQATVERILADHRSFGSIQQALLPPSPNPFLTRDIQIQTFNASNQIAPCAPANGLNALQSCQEVTITIKKGPTTLAETSLILGRR
jgi:prepilin-type N-terminal cleavage/methylation domain-containing protein